MSYDALYVCMSYDALCMYNRACLELSTVWWE